MPYHFIVISIPLHIILFHLASLIKKKEKKKVHLTVFIFYWEIEKCALLRVLLL